MIEPNEVVVAVEQEPASEAFDIEVELSVEAFVARKRRKTKTV